jgi:hypothetical protein
MLGRKLVSFAARVIQKRPRAERARRSPGCVATGAAKMSASKLGRTHSVSTKLAMSLSRSNSIKIEVTDLELNIKTIYHSISEAARVLNMPAGFTGLRSVARVARAMHPPPPSRLLINKRGGR